MDSSQLSLVIAKPQVKHIHSLLNLPTEIRERIYLYVFVQSKFALAIRPSCSHHYFALVHTCQAIRNEAWRVLAECTELFDIMIHPQLINGSGIHYTKDTYLDWYDWLPELPASIQDQFLLHSRTLVTTSMIFICNEEHFKLKRNLRSLQIVRFVDDPYLRDRDPCWYNQGLSLESLLYGTRDQELVTRSLKILMDFKPFRPLIEPIIPDELANKIRRVVKREDILDVQIWVTRCMYVNERESVEYHLIYSLDRDKILDRKMYGIIGGQRTIDLVGASRLKRFIYSNASDDEAVSAETLDIQGPGRFCINGKNKLTPFENFLLGPV